MSRPPRGAQISARVAAQRRPKEIRWCAAGQSRVTATGTAPWATTAEGESWDLVVAPGTYADNDQGLLVGIDRTSGS